MKHATTLFLSLAFCGRAFCQTTDPAPYCPGGYDDADGVIDVPHYIEQLTLDTFSNYSGTTQYPGAHYVFYNNLSPVQLVKGKTYSLSVKHDGGMTLHFVGAFIDFNRNNSFNDPGECVLTKSWPGAMNPLTTSITVPAGAATGLTRMRVLAFEDDPFTGSGADSAVACTADATGSLDWGETEDYAVMISAPVTGIGELTATQPLLYYPNPARTQVQLSASLQGLPLQLCDLYGRVLLAFPAAPEMIDIRSLTPGIYVLRGGTTSDPVVQKLEVQP